MTNRIQTTAFWLDVVEWLQENVGRLLWSDPIIEWQGEGWRVVGDTIDSNTGIQWVYYIEVDDPKLAMLAALRWS